MSIPVENIIEVQDKVDRVISKLNFISSAESDLMDDGLSMVLDDVVKELKEISPILR